MVDMEGPRADTVEVAEAAEAMAVRGAARAA